MREDVTKKELFGYTFQRTYYDTLREYRNDLLDQMGMAHEFGRKYTSEDGHIFLSSPDSSDFSFFTYGKDYVTYIIYEHEFYRVRFFILKNPNSTFPQYSGHEIPSYIIYRVVKQAVLKAEKNCRQIAIELETKGDHDRLHLMKGPIDHYFAHYLCGTPPETFSDDNYYMAEVGQVLNEGLYF